jgi:hypothetical protein
MMPTVEQATKLIVKLLSWPEDHDFRSLLNQAESLKSVTGSSDHLYVHPSEEILSDSIGYGLLPVAGYVDESSGEPLGEFLLWTNNGQLWSIEYATYLAGDDPWPPLAQIRPGPQDSRSRSCSTSRPSARHAVETS